MEFKNKMRARDAKINPVRSIGIAVFVMFVISGLMLLLLAVLLYQLEPGESFIKIGIIAVYVLSGIVGGFLMGKLQKEQKYLWGLAAGGIYFVILFLLSAAVKGGFEMEMSKAATTLILCAAAGMVGGMAA